MFNLTSMIRAISNVTSTTGDLVKTGLEMTNSTLSELNKSLEELNKALEKANSPEEKRRRDAEYFAELEKELEQTAKHLGFKSTEDMNKYVDDVLSKL